MVINCVDPVFLGSAVYTTVDGVIRKLSRLQRVRELPSDVVEIITLNNTYLAMFTDKETYYCFVRQMNTHPSSLIRS